MARQRSDIEVLLKVETVARITANNQGQCGHLSREVAAKYGINQVTALKWIKLCAWYGTIKKVGKHWHHGGLDNFMQVLENVTLARARTRSTVKVQRLNWLLIEILYDDAMPVWAPAQSPRWHRWLAWRMRNNWPIEHMMRNKDGWWFPRDEPPDDACCQTMGLLASLAARQVGCIPEVRLETPWWQQGDDPWEWHTQE